MSGCPSGIQWSGLPFCSPQRAMNHQTPPLMPTPCPTSSALPFLTSGYETIIMKSRPTWPAVRTSPWPWPWLWLLQWPQSPSYLGDKDASEPALWCPLVAKLMKFSQVCHHYVDVEGQSWGDIKDRGLTFAVLPHTHLLPISLGLTHSRHSSPGRVSRTSTSILSINIHTKSREKHTDLFILKCY